MRRHWWSFAGVIAGGAVLYIAGLTVDIRAQQPPPTIKTEPCVAIVSVEGKDNYGAYCAVCHGTDGKGEGPAAPALKMPVPDLTTIAQRHGKFNSSAVQDAIAGSGKMPAAHGDVAMPMWGPVFRAAESDRAVTTLRVHNLVKYLESIQQK